MREEGSQGSDDAGGGEPGRWCGKRREKDGGRGGGTGAGGGRKSRRRGRRETRAPVPAQEEEGSQGEGRDRGGAEGEGRRAGRRQSEEEGVGGRRRHAARVRVREGSRWLVEFRIIYVVGEG